jgi:hypothetical protein
METTLDRDSIDALNRQAAGYVRTLGWSPVEALEHTMRVHGMIELRRSDQCVVYQDGGGRLVNCWIEGPMSDDIAPGGKGFDDQVEID